MARLEWLRRLAAPVVLAALPGGCAAPPPAAPPRNLIVISLDTVRASALGSYGYPRPTTPVLDAFARRGVRFEDASAPSPWTKPSHAAMLTGLYPSHNGAVSMEQPIAPEVLNLATRLREQGYQSTSVISVPYLKQDGFETGFDAVLEIPAREDRKDPSPVTDLAIRFFTEWRKPGKPFFLLLHYYDAHSDYGALPEFEQRFVKDYDGQADGSTAQLLDWAIGRTEFSRRDVEHLRDLYDAGVRQLDAELGRLFQFLERTGVLGDTAVLITADHGEEFFEHGSLMHGHTQFEEMVRVPLLVVSPSVPPDRRVSDPVSLVDVVPTCLDLLGLPVPADLDGVTLAPLWRAGSDGAARLATRPLFFEADGQFPPPPSAPLPLGDRRAVRIGKFKLHYNLATKLSQLYNLGADPGEQFDIKGEQPAIAAELQSALERFLASGIPGGAPRTFTQEELETVRALGYIGGS